jgi:hypothetical protein
VNTIALDSTSNTAQVWPQYWTAMNNVWTLGSGGIGWRLPLIGSNYTATGVNTGTYVGWVGGLTTATNPLTITIDGAGSLWIANNSTASGYYPLTGITVTGSRFTVAAMASNGFPTGASSGATTYAATPDGSGNVWVANTDGSMSQILGLATPVATPIFPGQFGVRP